MGLVFLIAPEQLVSDTLENRQSIDMLSTDGY
jgi:hypothetical protein